MRLIIKDYLLQLKEKDELDLLLCDLVFQMGYPTDSRPETGNRQYGVDIRAHNEDSVLLCTVKQGNMNRKNWDSDPNSVRQSLNEIFDCYLNLYPIQNHQKELHIIVATNGMMDEAVSPNWEGYVRQHTAWDGKPVIIEFWNIDKITDCVQRFLLDEHIFDSDMRSLLRRALYYIGEYDYPNKYYEQIIDDFFDKLAPDASVKELKKKLSGVFLATQMIAHYASEERLYSIAISVSEYLIIRYWNFLFSHELFEKGEYCSWLFKFLAPYERWSFKYYSEMKFCCETKNCLPPYDVVEQRVKIYDILGHLSSFAYYLCCKERPDSIRLSQDIQNTIIKLINNYSQAYYPAYDVDIGVISMVFRLLNRAGNRSALEVLVHNFCTQQAMYYQLYGKYPTPLDTYKEAVDIHIGTSTSEYKTSAFWGVMLEWIALLENEELYNTTLQPFLSNSLKDVTKCAWFLRADEEKYLYSKSAMYNSGDGVEVATPKEYQDFRKYTSFIISQYSAETFSFDKYGFPALEFILARYFNHFVRVMLEG